jgi:superfamily II DNA or RNA helicase
VARRRGSPRQLSRLPSRSPIPARYLTGLTATPYRRDGLQPIIAIQCGPGRHTIPAGAIRHEHDLDLRVIRRDTEFDANVLPREASIQEIYAALAADNDRLRLVVADALDLPGDGRAVMMLTERRDHLERLAEALRDDVTNLVVLHVNVQIKARRDALRSLAELPEAEPRVLLATGRYIGEGFDDPRLDTLLLTMPIAWKRHHRPIRRSTPPRPPGQTRRPHLRLRRWRSRDAISQKHSRRREAAPV